MDASLYERFQSGEVCIESGRYEFDGYVLGPADPPPQAGELETSLGIGDTFPPAPRQTRPCYWKLVPGVSTERRTRMGQLPNRA